MQEEDESGEEGEIESGEEVEIMLEEATPQEEGEEVSMADEEEQEIEALMACPPADLAPPERLGRAQRIGDAPGLRFDPEKAAQPAKPHQALAKNKILHRLDRLSIVHALVHAHGVATIWIQIAERVIQ